MNSERVEPDVTKVNRGYKNPKEEIPVLDVEGDKQAAL